MVVSFILLRDENWTFENSVVDDGGGEDGEQQKNKMKRT